MESIAYLEGAVVKFRVWQLLMVCNLQIYLIYNIGNICFFNIESINERTDRELEVLQLLDKSVKSAIFN